MKNNNNVTHRTLELEKRARILDLWRFEYTRRKFLKDCREGVLDREKILQALEDVDKKAAQISLFAGQPVDTDQFCHAAIYFYHKQINNNPKYTIDDFRYDEYEDICLPLLAMCSESVKIIHEIVYTYGFFIEDMLCVHHHPNGILDIINKDGVPSLPYRCFIKKASDISHECRFNFADRDGVQFFEEEQDGFLYVYYNVTSENFYLNNELLNINLYIKQYKQVQSRGDKNSATIQICIRMRNSTIDNESTINWCYHAITLYITWIKKISIDVRSYFILQSIISGRKSDNLSPEARCVGLLLWDAKHIEGIKISDMEKILSGKSKKSSEEEHPAKTLLQTLQQTLRSNFEPSQLRRDLLFTEYCVDNMAALTMKDWEGKRQWGPNIKIGKHRKRKKGTT